MLLANGVDTENCPGEEERTALHGAVWANQTIIVRTLLYADANVDAADATGTTPLMFAVRRGNVDITKQLLQAKADVTVRTLEKDTALHYTAQYGQVHCTQLLLHCNAEIEALNIWGLTPLLLALTHGHSKTAKCLIDGGADLHVKDRGYKTPLFLAVKSNLVECVAKLLEHGACPYVADNTGNTPLTEAVYNDNMAIVVALLKANCTVNVLGKYTIKGKYAWVSPLELAVHKTNITMVTLLYHAGHSVASLWKLSSTDSIPEFITSDSDMMGWFENMLHSPRRLLDITAIQIRHMLGYNFQYELTHICLPKALKEYLLYIPFTSQI